MNVPASAESNRLALSRERIRVAMRNSAGVKPQPQSKSISGSQILAGAWLDSLQSLPVVKVVTEALRSWWKQHPVRMVGIVAGDAVKSIANPVAQRYPFGLVLGAFLVGAVLAWNRPWRWVFRPVLLAGLLPQIFSSAIANLPIQSWIPVLTSLLRKQGESRQAGVESEPMATHPPDQKTRTQSDGAWPGASPHGHS